MNLALWIAAGVLAAVLVIAAVNKLVLPKERLVTAPGGGWAGDFTPGAIRAIAVVELLGTAGLILPAVTGIAAILVPLAAAGAALLFTGAVIVRLRQGDRLPIAIDLVYLALAVFIAWGRFGPHPFPR
jgi:DoxX-like family